MNSPETILNKQRAFFRSGATRSVAWRKTQLQKLKASLLEHETEILAALYQDLGKAAMEAYETELGFVLSEINHALKHIRAWTKSKKVPTPLINFPSTSSLTPEPYGTVLIMSPWNYPLQLTLAPLVAAIAAGNTAVLKPSRYSQATSGLMKTIIEQTFDPEYIALFEGGSQVNTELLALRYDYIFFTGSTAVGKVVLEAASCHATPCALELGGKSPVIIDETADIALAAKRIMWGKLINAGQTCVAPDYVLIHESCRDAFICEAEKAIQTSYGNAVLENPNYPKIINEKHYTRLKALLTGATIAVGGDFHDSKQKIAPTILTEVSSTDAVMQEEIFGPILPIITFTEISQAVSFIEEREKPLALYLFSTNRSQQKKLMARLSFGGGCINDTLMHLTNPNLPFGGVGASGMNAYHGKWGFDLFSHKKGILKKSNRLDFPVRYAPYSQKKFAFIRKFMK